MAKLTVSLAQMPIAVGDVKRNYQVMGRLVTEAAKRGSKLVVLPELWSSGYALDQAKDLAQTLSQGLFAQMSKIATESNIAITGSLLEKRGIEASNSMPFFSPNGQMLGVYRKIHLFRPLQEDAYLQAGSSPLVIDLPWGRTGFGICYDLRFPELFRRYAIEGAVALIISAEWPAERIEHWRTLLMARAIENQCYVIAANAAGEAGPINCGGHSMIIDPWGKIIIEGSDEPALLTIDIEIDRIAEVRQRFSVLDDRRPETYEALDLGF